MQDAKTANLKSGVPAELPVLVRAINITLRALEDRGRLFRNLMVAVVTVAVASVLFSGILRRWLPLSGFILLIPLTGGYLILDSRRVRRWRHDVLQLFQADTQDFGLFQTTMPGLRHLPAQTLRSMLKTLPERLDSKPDGGDYQLRQEFESSSRRHEQKVLASALLLTAGLSAVAAAILYSSAALWLCSLGFMILFGVLKRSWKV